MPADRTDGPPRRGPRTRRRYQRGDDRQRPRVLGRAGLRDGPGLDALQHVEGVSLSGTGPSFPPSANGRHSKLTGRLGQATRGDLADDAQTEGTRAVVPSNTQTICRWTNCATKSGQSTARSSRRSHSEPTSPTPSQGQRREGPADDRRATRAAVMDRAGKTRPTSRSTESRESDFPTAHRMNKVEQRENR